MMDLLDNVEIEEIESILNNEGFWYALRDGGYLKPEDILQNKEDIDKVQNALEILVEFEDSLNNIVEQNLTEEE